MHGELCSLSVLLGIRPSSACVEAKVSVIGDLREDGLSTLWSLALSRLWGWGSSTKSDSKERLSGKVVDGGAGWLAVLEEEWISSLLCGVRAVFSLKLKRGEVSAVVGEEGPALDTVLEGPLLSAWRKIHKR